MKERPILFSGEMVRAILDGRKTQTRRVVKPQPEGLRRGIATLQPAGDVWAEYHHNGDGVVGFVRCPYGQPGDRLWVRETWATVNTLDHLSPAATFQYDRPPSVYMAAWTGAARNSENRGKWRPSIFMPRWASRLTLEVVSIRVERVQDITLDAMRAEGVRPNTELSLLWRESLADNFRTLWDSINAKRGYGWAVNPWVWVVEFKRI